METCGCRAESAALYLGQPESASMLSERLESLFVWLSEAGNSKA
jgi:hypothetical protein